MKTWISLLLLSLSVMAVGATLKMQASNASSTALVDATDASRSSDHDRHRSSMRALTSAETATTAPAVHRLTGKVLDASDNGYWYSYAPSIVYENNVFHMFYCSSGSNGGWDDIRYAQSDDGRVWSAPVVVLTTTDLTNERAACDPSVVKYQGPNDTQPYYYLFYSGNKKDVQTVMFVARSPTIMGPYAKWTTNRTWTVGASNPQIIIGPRFPKPDGSSWYGAGQQTVVVRDNRLVSWYTDDTTCSTSCVRLFSSSTNDPTNWPVGTMINVHDEGSVDVKYDPQQGEYVMFSVVNGHGASAALTRRYSIDGFQWAAPEVLCDADCFPNWTNNPGVSGDENGRLIDGRALVVYGAPFDLNPGYNNDCKVSPAPLCWAYWDLYGSAVNPRGSTWNEIEWGWQWPGMTSQHKLALGDYDGDGKTDRGIVDHATGKWHVLASGGGFPFPWGWEWVAGTQYELALGDYDGDGKTDRALVDRSTSKWYVIASSGSSSIPWGWQWSGMTSQHKLALGDYDGDGRTDRGIVDQATGKWHVLTSGGSYPFPWGWEWVAGTQYELALGDYDGDGKTDRALVDRSTSQWYVIASSGSSSIPWGWQWSGMTSQHTLALGDYDGDGKTDGGIFDRATRKWHVLGSGGSYPFPWGWQMTGMSSNSQLALGDYDGDGRTDRAVVDRQTSRWYVMPSTPFQIY